MNFAIKNDDEQAQAARKYFATQYVADNIIRKVNADLVDMMFKFYDPESVFEFGCGQGKNLDLVTQRWLIMGNSKRRKRGSAKLPRTIGGIDINKQAVDLGRKQGRWYILHKDENFLSTGPSNHFDVCFTCSVLDHIPHPEMIVAHLKRMAIKGILLCETNDVRGPHYYPHDYHDLGFKSTGYTYRSNDNGDGALYKIWRWDKPWKIVTSHRR